MSDEINGQPKMTKSRTQQERRREGARVRGREGGEKKERRGVRGREEVRGQTNLPERPILWRYVSEVLGKSKLMTTFTACISIPRVNRSDRGGGRGGVV